MTGQDETPPVVPAQRLLAVASALSDGASRMHARLRHLDPADRDEVLELVASQVSEIVGLWTDLVRGVVSTEEPEPVRTGRNGIEGARTEPRDVPGYGEGDFIGEAHDLLQDTGEDGENPRWRSVGSAAQDRWEVAYGPQGARRDEARTEIERLTRDELTGVLNRQAGLAALGRELDRCRRSNERLVLGFLNVDRLKALNEMRGSRVGDELLRKVAAALRATLRSYDVIVRLGGDEFLFSLPGADMATAEQRFNEFGVLLAEEAPGTTASVGFAELREGDTLDDLISRADTALVKSRRSRRRAR
ncbi:MAG TPA: GGDEF domain-containing protein [Acidimicrobiales bacterium]|nr:GGDEF domain-containing protein [Acidimicrobiales bacterium]